MKFSGHEPTVPNTDTKSCLLLVHIICSVTFQIYSLEFLHLCSSQILLLYAGHALAEQLKLKSMHKPVVSLGNPPKMCPGRTAEAEVLACQVVPGLSTPRATWRDS